MLKLTWIEFFLRIIPEIFILIWGVYVISRKSFDIPQYVLSSIIISILIFFIRWLPIYLGVHMMINIIITISIMFIIGIPLIKSIYSTLLMFFILSLSEFLNMLILNLLNVDTNLQLLEPVKKCVLEIPSLAITSIFIIIIHYLLKTKEGMKYVSN
ncbi:hypothetical protein HBE96_17690 [Clostridium sp. P21]|uniref:Uncharacterized protein n=1 Tax=Clostridium muellerianum TaxID=2716538 RepID=A0A7Y0EJU9_9CLOT|nr:hypothetical protein [Clostridium muellerianum]NMM64452.1 hypothetical protein [Clostridium muellerianum]